MMTLKVFVLATLFTGVLSSEVTQYLALAPDSGIVTWLQATFPSNYTATSASEVTITDIDTSDAAAMAQVGAWQNLDMDGTPTLTIKIVGDNLYAQLNTGIAPTGPSTDGTYPGGCCVDTFRSFNNSADGDYTSYDVRNVVFDIFENVTDTDTSAGNPFAYANHLFDMTTGGLDNDNLIAILDVTYHEPSLDYGEVDAIVFFDTVTQEAVQTKDGLDYFSFYQNLGTLSKTTSDSIYNIMFVDGDGIPEQFHQNGLTRFQALDGTWVLGMTFRTNSECILLKCPYTYSSADGGGTILQRFGEPSGHRFGYSSSDGAILAMHNMYHTVYDDSRETITLFINSQDGYTNSRIFEFDVKLTPEPSTSYDDTVFDTDYLTGTASFSTDTWGGGRPIGQGVWLVGFDSITVIDQTSPDSSEASEATRDDLPPPLPDDDKKADDGGGGGGMVAIYDPFSFITAV